MKVRFTALFAVLALACANAAQATPCSTPASMMIPPPPAAYTHQAFASGDWANVATWDDPTSAVKPTVPGNGAIVLIPAGIAVNVKTQESSRLRYVKVQGELRMWIHGSTRLYLDTLVVDSHNPATGDGHFVIGTPGNPVKPAYRAEIVFTSWDGNTIDLGADPEELGRGLVAMGKVSLYGDPKTHWATMTADAAAGVSSLALDSLPGDWDLGDEIVLPGSFFRRVGGETSSQDEVRVITSLDPVTNTIGLDAPLSYAHVRPAAGLRFHVANLTRNLIFRSEATTTSLRGHIMLMDRRVDIRNVAMLDLGRTDKSIPLDDFTVEIIGGTTPPADPPDDYDLQVNPTPANRRGRYALHFHINGILPGQAAPSKVYNSVVRRTRGWGFVNHSSHVDFTNNVAHDFHGAGFVTEMGNELGNFTDNIAIRGRGTPGAANYRPVKIVFENMDRPQPLGDFAWTGDGFWFQGPAIRATGNVASGVDGSGMMWHTTGSPMPNYRYAHGDYCHARYSGFAPADVATIYPGLSGALLRTWERDADPDVVVIADLPILEMADFTGYANLVGFRLRFSNHDSLAWYDEPGYDFAAEKMNGSFDEPHLLTQHVDDLTLWNNEGAFSMRYVTNTAWDTVEAINRLDYTLGTAAAPATTSSYIGGELFHALEDIDVHDLTIDGYEVATRRKANGVEASIGFTGVKAYSNHLLDDTMVPGSCATPAVTVGGTSSTTRPLTLGNNAAHRHYLARYRIAGEQQWQYATAAAATFPAATTLTLTGLATGQVYQYQVAASCHGPVLEPAPPANTSNNYEAITSSYTAATTFTN